jgi:hypothetical protein
VPGGSAGLRLGGRGGPPDALPEAADPGVAPDAVNWRRLDERLLCQARQRLAS